MENRYKAPMNSMGFKFNLQNHGGGGSESHREIPNESADEARLRELLDTYNQNGLANADEFRQKALESARSAYIPDWNEITKNTLAAQQQALADYQAATSGAAKEVSNCVWIRTRVIINLTTIVFSHVYDRIYFFNFTVKCDISIFSESIIIFSLREHKDLTAVKSREI